MAIEDRIEYTPLPPIPNPTTEDLQQYLQAELLRIAEILGEISER